MNYAFKLKSYKSDKPVLIFFRTYFNNEKKYLIYSTGEKILPSEWDEKNSQPNNLNGRKKQSEIHRSINKQLNRYSDFFIEIVNRYKNIGEELTIATVKEAFDVEFKKKKKRSNDFFKVYDKFIEAKQSEYMLGNIVKTTMNKYKFTKELLLEFEKSAKINLSFSGFNEEVYNKFLNHCINKRGYSANTLHKMAGFVKVFLNWALDNKFTFNNDFLKFKKPKKFKTDEVALTMEQVKEIYNYDFSKNPRLEKVRDLFVLGCTTSLRFGNYSKIDKSDIQNDCIRVVDFKSKSKKLSIPLNPISKEILEKYDYKLPRISNQKMNEYIKEVFKVAGFDFEIKKTMKYGNKLVENTQQFYERISSHTARRSFITIMKNQRVPDKVIMSITGHKNLNVFNTYYRPSEDDKVNYMNEVFN